MPPEGSRLFKTRAEWGRWLRANHGKAREIWLIRYRKETGKKCISYDDAVEEAICFGWIDGQLKKLDEDSFVTRFSPRKMKSVWSLANKKRALRMIREGRMTADGMKTIKAAKESGAWQNAYTSGDVPEMPADLRRALRSDGEAWRNFCKFADTYRGGYIQWVVSAKRQETRDRRIAVVVERSRANKRAGVDP